MKTILNTVEDWVFTFFYALSPSLPLSQHSRKHFLKHFVQMVWKYTVVFGSVAPSGDVITQSVLGQAPPRLLYTGDHHSTPSLLCFLYINFASVSLWPYHYTAFRLRLASFYKACLYNFFLPPGSRALLMSSDPHS